MLSRAQKRLSKELEEMVKSYSDMFNVVVKDENIMK